MMTFLPYHTHPMFPTVLAILPQSIPPTLKFLFPYIQSLGNPSRHTVVYTAIHNQAFFAALNTYVLQVSRLGFQYPALLSFWASVVAESTAGMLDLAQSGRQEAQRQHQEDVIMRLMPVLNEGLTLDGVPELRIGCYMVVTVLASKAVLSEEALTALMDAVSINWTGTTHAGLICLAVLAQKRDATKIPRRTFKALMAIENLVEDLKILKTQYRVDKLVIGLVLGIVGKFGKTPSTTLTTRLRTMISANLMDSTLVEEATEAMLRILRNPKQKEGFDIVGALSDVILHLAASDDVGATIRKVILESGEASKSLQQRILDLPIDQRAEAWVKDEDMPDADQQPTEDSFEMVVERIQTQTAYEISFLSHSESYVFSSLSQAFVLATNSSENLARFSNLPILKKSLAMTAPLFISFFIRIWSGPFAVEKRVAALGLVADYFEHKDLVSDVQILLPYIFYALADPAPQVRRSSSKLVLLLAKAYRQVAEAPEGPSKLPVLGNDQIYGQTKEIKGMVSLSFDEVVKLLEDFLVPNLEESLLDASHIIQRFGCIMNGTTHRSSTKNVHSDFKSSWKHSVFVFFCDHVSKTPLMRVKNRLLKMLNQVQKVNGTSRSKVLLPLLMSCTTANEDSFVEKFGREQLEPRELMTQLVGIVSSTDRDGIKALKASIGPGKRADHPIFNAAIFERIRTIWPTIKQDLQLSLAEDLLEIAVSSASTGPDVAQASDAIDTLRKVKLSSRILSGFLKNLPSLTGDIEGKSFSAKRRKTTPGHETIHTDSGALENSLRKYTIVLELIDSCGPEHHSDLLNGVFDVLAGLQSYKRHSGTELGYLEVITLNIAYTIVSKLEVLTFSARLCCTCTKHEQKIAGSQVDRSAVRADVLVDCISTTENPQVQQAALLLVGSIASVTPELILHSVMPVFTFMGTGLMRNDDEYSVHVVKKVRRVSWWEMSANLSWQTMESVIPRLVQSLHQKKADPLISISQLLLSFVAAYKDIPNQRRQELFVSLIDKTGPNEFLFALVVLLIDKYPGRKKVLDFAAGLVTHQKVVTQLSVSFCQQFQPASYADWNQTVEKYLDTALDLLEPKPTLSAHLLNNEAVRSVHDKVVNLLPLLPIILKERRLNGRIEKLLSQGGDEASLIRSLYGKIFEQILSLREKTNHNEQGQPFPTPHGVDSLS